MDAHGDLMERLAVVPEEVAAVVLGLDEETLRRRPAEGEWSMKEVCGHLVVDARTWQERIILMTTQDDPYLERIDPADGVSEGGYQEARIEDILSDFRRIRRQMIDTLQGLDDEGWQRNGRHWSEGEITVAEACSIAIEHGASHLEQMRDLLP